MELVFRDWVALGFFIGAILFLGFRAVSRRKTGLEDYVLAGRKLTLPMFVATLVTTWYGGVLGAGEFSFRFGISNWLFLGFPYYVFAAAYALFLTGKVRGASGMTIPDHLEKVFGRKMALIGALLVFIIASPADELLMLGMLGHWIFNIPVATSMLLVMGVASAYLFKGGLRSDVWTNILQFFFMFCGFFVILPFCLNLLGGPGYLRANLPPLHLTWHGGNSIPYLLTWFFIAVWTIVDPLFHQRCCAAKDSATARKGILISIAFWCLFDFMTTTAGLYARALLPGVSPILAYPILADALLPSGMMGIFIAGMSASMLASLEGTTLVSAISLGKDGLGRLLKIRESQLEMWVRWSLLATLILAFFMAWWIPSVVGLWYAVGSAVIPGLLLPLLAVYFPKIRIERKAAISAALSGWVISSLWVILTNIQVPNICTSCMPDIQPLYPGLFVSAVIWGANLLAEKIPWLRIPRARKVPGKK